MNQQLQRSGAGQFVFQHIVFLGSAFGITPRQNTIGAGEQSRAQKQVQGYRGGGRKYTDNNAKANIFVVFPVFNIIANLSTYLQCGTNYVIIPVL